MGNANYLKWFNWKCIYAMFNREIDKPYGSVDRPNRFTNKINEWMNEWKSANFRCCFVFGN